MKENRPIGFYLRQFDQLLTEGIDRMHAAVGITRRQWQLLHTLHRGEASDRAHLRGLLGLFADASGIHQALHELIARGLVWEAHELQLTEAGAALHADCLQRQEAFRARATQGLTAEDYQRTIATLERMIGNLAGDPRSQP